MRSSLTQRLTAVSVQLSGSVYLVSFSLLQKLSRQPGLMETTNCATHWTLGSTFGQPLLVEHRPR